MFVDDELYQAFLEEMNNLEHFRLAYLSSHSSAQLGRDDPEVKRLIEAMAFLTARTNLASQRNIRNTRRRLFAQYFPFLLAPLPAMAMLQCEITGRFTEAVTIPKGSQVIVAPDEQHLAYFRLLYDLRILPISLTKVETMLRPQSGLRALLHFRTSYPRKDNIGTLSIYINHLNNYAASLQILYTIKEHLQQASFFVDEQVTEIAQGEPCAVSFGAPVDYRSTVNSDLYHPLQQARHFFHFPQQELYINFDLPKQLREWTAFTICLDFDGKWPKNLHLNNELFQLFTVPVSNLHKSMAQPILCDGTQDRYPIRYPEPRSQFCLHSLLGVYRIEEEGLLPLPAGVVGNSTESYEIEHSQGLTREQCHYLLFSCPSAFTDPVKIAVDALWMQPWFSERASDLLDIMLYDRHIDGVSWEFLGEVCPHRENILVNDVECMLQFLSLQRKPYLHLQDIHYLLNALGSLSQSYFEGIPELMLQVEVKTAPRSKITGGLCQIYQIQFKEFEQSYRPRVEAFLRQLFNLLNAFDIEGEIMLEANISSTQEVITFS